ncbi:MAG: S8 family serine peptidase [bacterium]
MLIKLLLPFPLLILISAHVISDEYGRTFTSGWQLVSLPFVPDEEVSVCGFINNPVFAAFGVKNGKYVGCSEAGAIAPGRAFWMHMPESELFFKGTPVSEAVNCSVQLTPGWNLISNPFLDEIDLLTSAKIDGAGFAETVGVGKVVFAYDPAARRYVSTTTLKPWEGYFIYSRVAAVMELSPAPVEIPPVESLTEESPPVEPPPLGPSAPQVVTIRIESAPDGEGREIGALDLPQGEDITLWAVGYDDEGRYVSGVEADWTADGTLTGFSGGKGGSIIYTPDNGGGVGKITASYGAAADSTGRIVVLDNTSPVSTYPFTADDSLSADARGNRYIAGQLIIYFAPGTSESRVDEIARTAGAVVVGRNAAAAVYQLKLRSGAPEDAEAALNGVAEIREVSPNYLLSLNAVPGDPVFAAGSPLINRWAFEKIGMTGVWKEYIPVGSPVIAVLDTGVDAAHPELAGRVLQGMNLINPLSGTSDVYNHGTSVAGVTAGAGDNGVGMAGICWNCRILPVKVCSDDGICPLFTVLNGIACAVNDGARVINVSVGAAFPSDSPAVEIVRAVTKDAYYRGALLVAASGNGGHDSATYLPAADRYVLSVAATDENDERAAFSNYGTRVDMAAPGENIYTTAPGGGYALRSGTSFSSAFVSGLAGLILSVQPGMTVPTLKNYLAANVDVLNTDKPVAGRINAGKLLQSLPLSQEAYLAGVVVNGDGDPVNGAMVVVDGGSQTLFTNPEGRFSFSIGSVNENGTTVKLKLTSDGYVEEYETVRVYHGSLVNGIHSITISMTRLPSTSQDATRAQVVHSDGTTENLSPTVGIDPATGLAVAETTVMVAADDRAVTFTSAGDPAVNPDVSLQVGDPSGAGADAAAVLGGTGALTGSIIYGDPTDEQDLEMFPGDFMTLSDTGAGVPGEGVLTTAGFARISLTDSGGQPITRFGAGAAALVTMRIPDGVQNPETGVMVAAGDTVPIFTFNEDSGEWLVEHNPDGTVMRSTVQRDADGLFVRFQVTHLSWYNLDWKGRRCQDGTPKVRFVDAYGNPVNGATLKVSQGGWSSDPLFGRDAVVEFRNAPADTVWHLWAEKDGNVSEVVTIKNCGDIRNGNKEFDLVLGACAVSCSSQYDCDDGNSLTYDTCRRPGSCAAACAHIPCASVCYADADCDDGNALTSDACGNPGTCQAYCSHVSCNAQCASDADCDDANPDTLEVCQLAGTCNATCQTYSVYCDLTVDKVNYAPADEMKITLTARNEGTAAVRCGAAAQLKRMPSPQVWNSFDENLYITVLPGQSVTRTITKVIPDDWAPTDSNEGSDYDIYTVRQDGTRWDRGDNFNIHVRRPCTLACSAGADCDDGDAATTDSCANAGTCSAVCVNGPCAVVCTENAGCDDRNVMTTDSCVNPGACSSACSNVPCAVACSNDSQCDDGDALTTDTCENAGGCASVCKNTPCAPACSADADCDDSNALTIDTCSNPAACPAACVNTPCSPLCGAHEDCDDGIPETIDTCDAPATCAASCRNTYCIPDCAADSGCDDGNPETTDLCAGAGSCSAACVNAGVNASAAPSTLYLVGGQAQSTLSCGTSGNVTFLEGRCDASDSWSALATGTVRICAYTSRGTFTPGCRVNGMISDDADTPVSVVNAPPAASIAASPMSGPPPLSVNFTGSCVDSDGACVSFLWNFGDDAPASTMQNPTHTFTAERTYFVTLTVTDNDGASTTKAMLIRAGNVNNESRLSAGYYHTCALTNDGSVKCWGYNYFGQLGDGTTTTYNPTPVSVTGMSGAVAVSGGSVHTCALINDGSVKCWGDNYYGQLGDGTTIDKLTPVSVTGMSGAVAVSGGYAHTCALINDGSVKCWGYNYYGQLGDGTRTTYNPTPVSVTGMSGAVAVSGGYAHTCALISDGSVKCWGYNYYGQLGDGTINNRIIPVIVVGF